MQCQNYDAWQTSRSNGTSEDMAITFINNSRAAQRQKYNHQYNQKVEASYCPN